MHQQSCTSPSLDGGFKYFWPRLQNHLSPLANQVWVSIENTGHLSEVPVVHFLRDVQHGQYSHPQFPIVSYHVEWAHIGQQNVVAQWVWTQHTRGNLLKYFYVSYRIIPNHHSGWSSLEEGIVTSFYLWSDYSLLLLQVALWTPTYVWYCFVLPTMAVSGSIVAQQAVVTSMCLHGGGFLLLTTPFHPLWVMGATPKPARHLGRFGAAAHFASPQQIFTYNNM